MHISPHDIVLEIGSGNNPHPRANILCDRLLRDNSERAGGFSIVIDRPFVIADGYHLPFRDKQFDYVICSHTLEHMDKPKQFLAEIERVAKAGYIEVPSILSERVFGWNFHHWHIDISDGVLRMRPKREGEQFDGFFHRLIADTIWFRRFFEAHDTVWYTQHEWKDHISFQIEGKQVDSEELATIDKRAWKLLVTARPALLRDVHFFVVWMIRRVKRKLTKITRKMVWSITILIDAPRCRASIAKFLACPSCHGNILERQRDTLICLSCRTIYTFDGVMPLMLSAQEKKKGY